ncbi:50S ribosomal protein L21 [Fluviispira sanaruensis]|uniref:Large ribosomal subunit protein bL21 n=1 Tax=Fluviispira sanaruensis TaxID=2493639 RepID=A0A4P2VGP3_FLUSA|nr:50S ribosomal protein L21 [Fluviispira sanaruensis]BBH51966.1 50S ribosomal protein L21 [Fluviispira sanaruensis]
MSSKTNYAVVNIFGRQYKVAEGDKIKASYIEADVGTTLPFSEVLMINKAGELKVGAPTISGAKVTAQVVAHGREDKVLVFKYLRKNKSKKMHGHRQPFTTLSITHIEG